MANEKEDVLQANEGGPSANIPDLKKKDKERKKAGAAWGGARGAANEFSGATGGTVARAAASAAGMAGELGGDLAAESALLSAEAAETGGIWATISQFFADLASTMLGRVALASAAFLLVAGAGMLGYEMMKGKGADASVGSPDLGGIADSMRVRAGGDDRLGVDSKGEIRFDPQAAKTAVAPPTAPTDVKADGAKQTADVNADTDTEKSIPADQLAHNLSGAQLTASLGNSFGSKNIFGGNSNAPKFGAGLGAGMPKFPGSNGKLSAMKATSIHATPSARTVNKGTSNKAFGQALIAKGLSNQGAAVAPTNGEAASSAAQGAFDQQQPVGGGLNTIGAPGGDTPPTASPSMLGSGAPVDTSVPTAPADPTPSGTDPGLQNPLQQISDLANQAMSNIQMGTIMMVLGAILIGVGAALVGDIATMAIGIALIAAGAALVLMGMMKIAAGKAEAQQAMAMGQQLASSIGNEQQGNVINYCTNNAITTGTAVQNCQPPDSVTNYTNQSAQNTADVQQVNQIPVTNTQIGSQ